MKKGNVMNRREFIRNAGLGAAALPIAGCSLSFAGSKGKRQKANLLFIWTDEQRADTMAAYGNTKIHAPNLNKLASESFVFKRTYITQPVCSPSRGSVMTGLWPHTSGVTDNNITLGKETQCLPEMIDSPQYQTAYMGKWHLGDEIFAQHGFDEWVAIEDGYSKYYSSPDKKQARSDYYHFLVSRGHKPGKNNAFSRNYAASLPYEESKPKFLATKACDFMQRHQDEPFILYINFLEPHMPFTGPFNNEHDPADVDLPENFNDPLEENEPQVYRKRLAKIIKKYGTDEKGYRKLIAKYWGLVTELDTAVGQINKKLEELGLADNTIVVFTSDHGDMMGSHRLVEKCVMYEESVKVPLLLRVPWMSKKQNMIEAPVSHIDLVPTLLDLMKCPKPQHLEGASLLPLMKGGKAAEDHVFIEWSRNSYMNSHMRTVVSPDGWKLSLLKTDKNQLFDLTNDPGETTNLYDSGKHADVIKRLTKKIHNWQKKTKDTLEL